MGFYRRALLRDPHEFGLRDVVAAGMDVRVEPATALDDPAWTAAELWAPGADVPVEVDVSRRSTPDSLLHDEVEEFEDELEDADEQVAGGVERVREHLAATHAIVAVQVHGSDETTGPAVAQALLDWYARRDDALLQVDGEGFFAGDELVVAT